MSNSIINAKPEADELEGLLHQYLGEYTGKFLYSQSLIPHMSIAEYDRKFNTKSTTFEKDNKILKRAVRILYSRISKDQQSKQNQALIDQNRQL